jgi:hypothetical protein
VSCDLGDIGESREQLFRVRIRQLKDTLARARKAEFSTTIDRIYIGASSIDDSNQRNYSQDTVSNNTPNMHRAVFVCGV